MLIDNPQAEHAELMKVFHGPDFPTGGIVVDSPAAISHAYATGKGSIRVRARFSTGRDEAGNWEATGIEKLGSGQWQLVVSEIPYMVQRAS
jgi:topoisomerase-4 subunit A